MKSKKRSLFGLSTAIFRVVYILLTDFKSIALLEAELACQSIATLILLLFIAASILTTTWMSLNMMIFFILRYYGTHPILAALVLFLVNILALCCLAMAARHTRKHFGFAATRQQLRNAFKLLR